MKIEKPKKDDLAVVMYTSGSTGKPKQIVLQKAAMMASAKATGSFFNLQPKKSALFILPQLRAWRFFPTTGTRP